MADAPDAPAEAPKASESEALPSRNEVWENLPPPNEDYQISSCGRFRSLVKHHGRDVAATYGKDNGSGYNFINFFSNGRFHRFYIHRLVAEAFIPNQNNKTQINHKNGNKKDNRVENLEWCTPSENMKHLCKKIGRRTSKPTPVVCTENGKVFPTQKEAASYAKIQPIGIRKCLSGKNKTAGGYHWAKLN